MSWRRLGRADAILGMRHRGRLQVGGWDESYGRDLSKNPGQKFVTAIGPGGFEPPLTDPKGA